MSSNIQINKTCLFCNIDFTAKTLYTKYCSHTCNRKHYKKLKREENIDKNYQQGKTEPQATSGKIGAYDQSIQLKQFLSINEASQLLGTCPRTIQRLIAKGSLEAKKIGSRCIITRNNIDKLFQ